MKRSMKSILIFSRNSQWKDVCSNEQRRNFSVNFAKSGCMEFRRFGIDFSIEGLILLLLLLPFSVVHAQSTDETKGGRLNSYFESMEASETDSAVPVPVSQRSRYFEESSDSGMGVSGNSSQRSRYFEESSDSGMGASGNSSQRSRYFESIDSEGGISSDSSLNVPTNSHTDSGTNSNGNSHSPNSQRSAGNQNEISGQGQLANEQNAGTSANLNGAQNSGQSDAVRVYRSPIGCTIKEYYQDGMLIRENVWDDGGAGSSGMGGSAIGGSVGGTSVGGTSGAGTSSGSVPANGNVQIPTPESIAEQIPSERPPASQTVAQMKARAARMEAQAAQMQAEAARMEAEAAAQAEMQAGIPVSVPALQTAAQTEIPAPQTSAQIGIPANGTPAGTRSEPLFGESFENQTAVQESIQERIAAEKVSQNPSDLFLKGGNSETQTLAGTAGEKDSLSGTHLPAEVAEAAEVEVDAASLKKWEGLIPQNWGDESAAETTLAVRNHQENAVQAEEGNLPLDGKLARNESIQEEGAGLASTNQTETEKAKDSIFDLPAPELAAEALKEQLAVSEKEGIGELGETVSPITLQTGTNATEELSENSRNRSTESADWAEKEELNALAENALQEVPGAEIPSVPEVELAELSQEIKPIEESAEMVAADGAVSHGHTSEKMQNQTFSVHAMSQAVLEESWEDTLFDEVQQTCHSEAMETLPKNASDSAIVSDAPAKAKRLPKASGARRLAGPGKGRNSARNLVTSPEEERRFEIAMSSQTLEELLAADESGEQTEVAEPIDFESDELNQTMSEMRTSVNVSEEELGEAGIVQGTESGVSELDAEDFEKNSSKKSQMEFFEFEIEDMELFQQKQEEAQHEESVSEETAEETAETKSEGETLENEASEENQSTSESSEMSDSEEAIFTVESTSCLSTSGMEEDFSESSVGEETVGAEEAESETVFMEVREPSSSVTSEVVTAEAEISEAEVSETGNFETEVCETETLVLENEASVLAEEAGISPSESVSGMSSIYRSTFKNRKDVRLIHDSKVEAAISASPAKRTVAYAAVCVSYEQKKSVINGRNAVVRGQNGTSGTQAAAGEEKEEEGDVELEFLLLPPEEFESKSIQELQNSAPVSQVSQVPQTTSESLDSHGSQDLQTSTAPKMLTEAGMLELDESEAAALESVPSLEAALPEVPEEKNTLKEGDSNSQDKTLQQRKNALRANGPLRFLNDPKPNAGVSENSAGSASNGMESELKMDSPAQTDSEFGAGSETEMQLELQDDSPREELGTEETAEKIVEESMEGTGGKGLVSSENGVPEALEMAVPADLKNAAERENAKTDSDAEIEHGTESGLELKADSVPGTDSEAGSGTGFAGSETKPEAEPQMLLNAETDTNQNSNAEVPRGESEEGMLLLDESPEMGTVQDSVSENSGIPQASAQSDEKRLEQMTEQFSEQVAVQVSEQLANQLADSIAEKVVEKTLDEVVRRLKTELELKAAEEADLESENSIQDSVQIGKSEASANAESNESVEETAALSLKEETDASDKAETSDKASRMVQNESGNPAFSGTSNEGKTASEKPTDGQEVDLDAIPEVLVLFDESEETLQANADSAEKTQNETAESGKPAFSQTANSGQAADFGQTAKSSQVANSSQTANSGLTRDSNAKLKEGTSSEAPGFVKLSGRKRKKKGTSAKVSASSEIVPEKTSIRSALTNSSESPKQTNQFAQTDSAPIQGGNLETAGVQAGISGGTGSRIELADPANSISNPFASAMKAKQEQQREIFASLPETLEPQQLMLYPCEGVVLNTESLIKTVYVENAENCDFVELNESQLAIIGKCQGETRVLVQFKEPDVEPQLFKVSVQEGNSNTKILSMWGKELEIQMNQVLANAGMSIFVFQNRIFIKGSLPESIQAEQVMKTVQKDFAQLIKMNPGLEIRGMSSQERKIVVVNLLFQTGLP